MTSAVVFAYHNVGVRCIQVLLKHGIDIREVVTHADKPNENIWFDSVAKLAMANGIPVSSPDDPNTPEFIGRIASLQPDFIFSFYYRMMLSPTLLAVAPRGAFNIHGSLLPKYRGRVPVNWAIIKGETETGATLHEMVAKPDAGRIVDQQMVAIEGDDNAQTVFNKVTGAAAFVLDRALPGLIAGTAVLHAQDLAKGSYYGGRQPADGVINWHDSAQNIHNLVRAVAPPYPGATTTMGEGVNALAVTIIRTRLAPPHFQHQNPGKLNVGSETVIALCGDGRMLRILEAEIDGKPHNEVMLAAVLGVGVHRLGA
jgi:methionyl-tRNA formyltransferase